MKCTWVDCAKVGLFPQKADDGEQWAWLCGEHQDKLDDAIQGASENPFRMLSCWVKAQGGSRLATKRMSGGQ